MSKTQSRDVGRASDAMKSQIRLLAYKKCYSVILEYSLKDKYMKEVVSEMDIITNFSTKDIIRKNKCQTRFIYKLVLK